MNDCVDFLDYDNNQGLLVILSMNYYPIYSCTMSSHLPSNGPVEYKTAQGIHPIAQLLRNKQRTLDKSRELFVDPLSP